MAENSLRRLRRAAGFSSAKAFAERVGIPAPTYAKYEQIDDGPDTSMPIKNAWAIADVLGCSIDALVGRGTDVPEQSESGVFLSKFEGLSPDNRELVADFLEIVGKRDAQEKERIRAKIAEEYKPYLSEFIAQFLDTIDLGEEKDAMAVLGGEATFRALFKSFVETRAQLVMQDEQGKKFEEARKVYAGLGYAVHEEYGPEGYSATKIDEGEEGYEEALEEVLAGVKEGFDRYAMIKAKEVTDGVMAAFDATYPQTGGDVSYYAISMP